MFQMHLEIRLYSDTLCRHSGMINGYNFLPIEPYYDDVEALLNSNTKQIVPLMALKEA